MLQLTLGRKQSNDICLEHDSISGIEHLCIQVEHQGKITLIHKGRNDSTINGKPFRKAILTPDDQLELGEFSIMGAKLIQRINKIAFKDRIDFTPEFEVIMPIMQEHEKLKGRISRPSNRPKYIKIGVSMVVIIVVIIVPLPNDNLRYPLIAGSSIFAALFSGITGRKNRIKKQLEDFEIEYDDLLRCPKCRTELTRKSTYWLSEKGRCVNINCDVTFKTNTDLR